jgi:hypothetical protein
MAGLNRYALKRKEARAAQPAVQADVEAQTAAQAVLAQPEASAS